MPRLPASPRKAQGPPEPPRAHRGPPAPSPPRAQFAARARRAGSAPRRACRGARAPPCGTRPHVPSASGDGAAAAAGGAGAAVGVAAGHVATAGMSRPSLPGLRGGLRAAGRTRDPRRSLRATSHLGRAATWTGRQARGGWTRRGTGRDSGGRRRRGEAVSRVADRTGEKETYFNRKWYVNGNKVITLKSSPPSFRSRFQLFAKSSAVSPQPSGMHPSSYPGQENPVLPTAHLLPSEMDRFGL